ncbi:hypothetical protein KAH55_14250 [bacterium]|nr:hypothetical protein [bacterium]
MEQRWTGSLELSTVATIDDGDSHLYPHLFIHETSSTATAIEKQLGEKFPLSKILIITPKDNLPKNISTNPSILWLEKKPGYEFELIQSIRQMLVLITAERKIQETQLFASIGQLLGGIVHNISSPLTGIIGYASFLQGEAEIQEEATAITQQATRIHKIIQNMAHKIRQTKQTDLGPVDLNSVLHYELEFAKANLVFKHFTETRFTKGSSLPSIHARYADISEIVNTLIEFVVINKDEHAKQNLNIWTENSDNQSKIIFEFKCTKFDAEKLGKIMAPHCPLNWLTSPNPDADDEVQTAGELIARIWCGCKKYNGRLDWALSTEQNLKLTIAFSPINS